MWLAAVAVALLAPGPAAAQALTLPLDERPDWVSRDGIVMAGSWEPLLFRVRRDGSEGYTPTAEQRAAYEREHSPEMVEELKAFGVNFVMGHCYKGAGLEAERESMADAVRFAKRCHGAGLRVGVYNFSGAFIWELFFQEMPEAEGWVLLDERGNRRQYGNATYRCYWDRNHPDAQAFYRGLVRFAVEDIQVDLLHFDNYSHGPGRDENSMLRFREYLRETFSDAELTAMGAAGLDAVEPAMTGPPDTLLRRAWLDYHAQSLADSYHDLGRYARSLRSDVLLECNPGGPGSRINTRIDHGRLLQGGEAFWDEGRHPGLVDGKLQTRIQTYKVARAMDNMAFAYATTPLELAEAMAFNLDCLGCVCWFEYGRVVRKPGSNVPMSPGLAPYIRFFHERRGLLRDAQVVADAAVLRSYPSQVFADPRHAALTAGVEQALIENRACFQIVYEYHLADLERFPALVLAGCVALSDGQVRQIRDYASSGGRLCVVGPAATHDEWMRPRDTPALADLADTAVIRIPEDGDVLAAIRRACGGAVSASVDGPLGLCCEVTEQKNRRLVHLVNYRAEPVQDVPVRLRVPSESRPSRVTLASPGRETDLALPIEQESDAVSFTVPTVETYEVAIAEFD